MQIQWSIEGEKQISRTLTRIGNQVTNWKPAMEAAVRRLKVEASQTAFATQGASLGEPWKPLSPEYARWKEKRYPGRGILVRTGKMQRSFQTRAGPLEGEIWNPTPYFKYHQSNAARSRIPRRMMLYITNPVKAAIVRMFQTYWHSQVHGNASLSDLTA